MIKEFVDNLLSNRSIEVITALATTGATFFAWRTTVTNKQQSKEQIEEQHRVERPRIIPLNKDLFLSESRPSPSWISDNSDPSPHDSYRYKELSYFNFTLINTGKSFALKIDLTFELIDGIDGVEEFEESNSQNSYSLSFKQHELKQHNPSVFSFNVLHKDKNSGRIYVNDYTIDSFVQRISLIKSNESHYVQLPKYFIELSNFHLFGLIQSKPRVKLTIQYTDQYSTHHTDTYIMQVKYKQLAFSKEKEYFLDFENVDEK